MFDYIYDTFFKKLIISVGVQARSCTQFLSFSSFVLILQFIWKHVSYFKIVLSLHYFYNVPFIEHKYI